MKDASKNKLHRGLVLVEEIGLLIVAAATVIAIGQEIYTMVLKAKVDLADLLLLFIFLEVLAMVVIYLESGKLPVRMPVYIGIVALARYLILDMKEMETWRIVAVSSAALILAVAVLVIRFGHVRFPYRRDDEKE